MANPEHLAQLVKGAAAWKKWRKKNLNRPELSGADLRTANLFRATLSGANFNEAYLSSTIFAAVDLSQTMGLETCEHMGPSTIGIDTIYKSEGKIPEAFLRRLRRSRHIHHVRAISGRPAI